MIGKQVQVIDIFEGNIVYNQDNLKSVLMKCGSHPIAVIAVAGMFRKGKSFLLNMFLRFLHRKTNNTDQLTGHVTGFEAKGGCARVTQGISFWSEPFFIKNKNGTEVAIVLCDSQGLFDDRTPTKINSFIFGFSAVIPSLLIYNLKDHIDENALDNLATFAPKMGRIGAFQHVMFLIRDWNDDEVHPLGSVGGDQYLDAILTDRNIQQMNSTRANIRKYFPSKSGFLLPPPGNHVERSKSYAIDISKVDDVFLSEFNRLCLKIFVDDVHIKTNGNEKFMSSDDILAFSTHLVKMYQDGKIDDPGTHWESDSKDICGTAKNKSYWGYKQWMAAQMLKETTRSQIPYVSIEFLRNAHIAMKRKATDEFEKTTKIYPHCREFFEKLDHEIEAAFKEIFSGNDVLKKHREAEIELEEARERERLLRIEQENDAKKKAEAEEENKKKLKELAEKHASEWKAQQKKLEDERIDAEKKRGFFAKALDKLIAVGEALVAVGSAVVDAAEAVAEAAADVVVRLAKKIF